MKNKLKISAVLVVTAIAILVVSALYSSIAYFSDKSTGWTETYRLPNTSYQVSISYEDGSQIKDLNNGDSAIYVVKIKNTGNIPMVFTCTHTTLDKSEEITIQPNTEGTVKQTYIASSDIDSLTKIVEVSVKPTQMVDEDNVGFDFSGEGTKLILYAK